MSKTFYANGKLLLTSEYVILYGAKALAIPLNLGQSLSCLKKEQKGILNWKAYYNGKLWFQSSIKLANLSILQSTSEEKANKLIHLIKNCNRLNPNFSHELDKWDIRTDLDFNPAFGFGSSSSLLSLLAQWAGIDPMQLYFNSSNGSGYDIACASAEGPILYQLNGKRPSIDPVHFKPSFSEKLWFVYLGEKQNSERSVSAFLKNTPPNSIDPSIFSTITEEIVKSNKLEEFGSLLDSHEHELSTILSMPTVNRTFNDFDGYAKSLGAWGGDFALLASNRDPEYVREYLKNNHFEVYYPYNKLVKQ